MKTLPYLKQKLKLELSGDTVDLPIKCFDLSKDHKTVYFWQYLHTKIDWKILI